MVSSEFRSLPPDPDAGSDKVLPLEPSTLTGSLENGLRYYIGHAAKPKGRVAMALAVNIGSLVEEDHERGVAHILEHLAFNATEKYNNHDIVRFLEGIGAEFGACQNAHTTFDETVYELHVPLDDVEKGLDVFAEFATHIRCDPEDLRKERGPVLEEWRGTRSSEGRAMESEWKVMCADCKYADRLPIGLESIIKNVSAETIKAFYKKWYTAENMAVVLMGDISDPDSILELVKKHLSIVPTSKSPNQPPRILLPSHKKPRFVIFTDKEHQEPSVQIIFQRVAPDLKSALDLRELIVEKLLGTVINNRLFKISRLPNPPFYVAMASSGIVTKTIYTGGLVAAVEGDNHERALETLLIEIARVQQHGLNQDELDAAISQEMAETESLYRERDQAYATELRSEYVRHFTSGELVVGRAKEASLTKTILQSIELDDLFKESNRWSMDQNCVIKATSFHRGASQKSLEKVIEKVEELKKNHKIEPWTLVANSFAILDSEPTPGEIVDSKEFPYLGAKEFTLGNGMKICFKPTQFLGDQLLLSGMADGGLSELSKEEFRTCSYAFRLAAEVGQFGHPPEAMSDILMGKRLEMVMNCTTYARQITADQSPNDLETCLQLIHRLFTHEVLPSDGDLTTALKFLKESIQNELRNPMTAFLERVRFINRNQNYMFEPATLEAVEKLDPDLAFKFFNDCFKNPAQFIFCITGSIEEDDLMPLVEKYLGSIPETKDPPVIPAENVQPAPGEFPQGVITEDVSGKMIEPQGIALITTPISLKFVDGLLNQAQVFTCQFCASLLEARLLRHMRFQEGEVYSVSAGITWRSGPSADKIFSGELSINFSCDPSSSPRLAQFALSVLSDLQEKECTKEEIDAILSIEQRSWEEQQEENSFWHSTICAGYNSRFYRKTQDLEEAIKRRDEARLKIRKDLNPKVILDGFQSVFEYPVSSRHTAITFSPKMPFSVKILQAYQDSSPREIALWTTGLCTAVLAAFFVFRNLRAR